MNHSFNIKVAEKYGVNIAIILENIVFWIQKNKANLQHYHNGEYWTYNSVEAFTRLFPYWTNRQIEYTLKKMHEKNLIKSGNHNKKQYDRTLWYSLTGVSKSLYGIDDYHSTKLLNGSHKNVKPIPDINTGVNNHTTYDIETSEDVSNDTLNMFPEEKIKPTVIFNELVEYWNKQTNLRTHKPTTKTYAKAATLFEQIKLGLFGQNKPMSQKYMDANNIQAMTLHKPASDEDIKQAIDRFNSLCDPGCPSFKTGYPKSCDAFLYNDATKSSFFYSLFGPDKEPVGINHKPIDMGIVRLYQDELAKNRKLNSIEYNELVKGVNFVITMYKEFKERINPLPLPRILTGKEAYRTHITFLRQRYVDTGVFTFSHIVNKNYWKKFIDWMGQVHKIDLYPSDASLNARKARYAINNGLQGNVHEGAQTGIMSKHAI